MRFLLVERHWSQPGSRAARVASIGKALGRQGNELWTWAASAWCLHFLRLFVKEDLKQLEPPTASEWQGHQLSLSSVRKPSQGCQDEQAGVIDKSREVLLRPKSKLKSTFRHLQVGLDLWKYTLDWHI